jgi:multidrug transporter EmrE-like cation transporter
MKLSNFQYAIIFASILTALETTGQSLLRKYYLQKEKQKNFIYPLVTWIIYGLCIGTLYMSYSHASEGVMEVLWNAGTTIIIPITGLIMFGEKIKLQGWFGILLTLIGSTMLGMSQFN